jgi:hypothetical protein
MGKHGEVLNVSPRPPLLAGYHARMDRAVPIAISSLLVLAGIVATLVVLGASVEAGVGTGIGALLYIGLAAAVLLE